VRGALAVVCALTSPGCVGQPECVPTGGGPYWVEEGQPVSFTASCETGAAIDGAAVQLTPMPAGATWDPATATFAWTPALDQAAVYRIELAVGGETGAVAIGVADAFDAAGNLPVVDPLAYPEELGLPVLFLSPAPTDPDQYSDVTVIYRGHTYQARGRLRGAASLGYPKNSYSLEFSNNDPFEEPAVDMVVRQLVLLSTFDDNSQLRQRLAYDLWNAMDEDHLAIRTYSAVVYLDGSYHGMYTVADHVDTDLLGRAGLPRDGNLYKAINHDANFRLVTFQDGTDKVTLHDGYEKKEGKPPAGDAGAFDDLDALVQWAATVDTTGFAAQRQARLHVRDYEDWWILVTDLLADDSAGKNSYHYHDPASGTWRYLPWDFNHALGQTWQTEREAADTDDDYTTRNRLFELTLAEPTLAAALLDRYRALRAGPLAAAAVLDRIDAMVAETEPSARRDQRRWQAAYQTYPGWNWRDDFTTWDQEIAYLRTWVADRWAFLEATY